MEDELFKWRWVEGMGRAMTEWKIGGVPIILNFEKGKMSVEFQLTAEIKEFPNQQKHDIIRYQQT